LFSAGTHLLRFTNDAIEFKSATSIRLTTRLYRDYSAWYHIVLAVDTTQVVGASRVKIYTNGVEEVSFSASADPTQNLDLDINSAIVHYIGSNGTNHFDGYLADVHFIDGQALTPTSFGQFDTNNVWQPKAYSGSYGTNGFKLRFSDNSSSTALGYDTSGNGNNWTPNNLSVAAGTGNDSLVDSPTNYGTDTGAGGEVRGNYATFNPINMGASLTLSDGNFQVASSAGSRVATTIALPDGQYTYAECTVVTAGAGSSFGIGTTETGPSDGSYLFKRFDSGNHNAGIAGTTISGADTFTLAANDVLGVAYDPITPKLTFYKNGVSSWSVNLINLTGKTFYFAYRSGTSAAGMYINTGQRAFAYTAPSGFKALCSTNIPTPMILNGATAMDVVTYTGTGATLTPTSSLGFSPDLVWIKGRSAATSHALYDSVRGAQTRLTPDGTNGDVTTDNGLTVFNSNGFTLGTLGAVNTNAATYAAWCWDESVSAGFDIVTYTGNGTNRTIAHSLGVAPQFIIIKQRTTASATNWAVWHSAFANTEYLRLNSTSTPSTAASYWNSTSPASAVFSLGTAADVNTNSGTYVAYLWAPVSGYSSFGSYASNGATSDGPFVYTGFAPRFVLVKSISGTATSWVMKDSARPGYNVAQAYLASEVSSAETTNNNTDIDFLSNGFKWRAGGAASITNSSTASTYIYAAFAENPFSIARAR
jgi:hypothetical protein